MGYSVLQHAPQLDLRDGQRLMMTPEHCKFGRLQEQFDVVRERSHKPMEERGNDRSFLEPIPNSANTVAGQFERATLDDGRAAVIVKNIDGRAGRLVFSNFDV